MQHRSCCYTRCVPGMFERRDCVHVRVIVQSVARGGPKGAVAHLALGRLARCTLRALWSMAKAAWQSLLRGHTVGELLRLVLLEASAQRKRARSASRSAWVVAWL